MKKLSKAVLSIWVLYHGLAILVMPSPQSLIVQNYGSLFRSYLNQIGMNTTWNLFSPEPASALFARIQLISQKFETGEKEIFWPPQQAVRDLNPTHRRFYYQFRYLLLDPKRLEDFLLPYFCRSKDLPDEVWLQVHVNHYPTLQELQEEAPLELKKSMTIEKQWHCNVET